MIKERDKEKRREFRKRRKSGENEQKVSFKIRLFFIIK